MQHHNENRRPQELDEQFDLVHYDSPLQMDSESRVPAKLVQQQVTLLAQESSTHLNQSNDEESQYQDALDHIEGQQQKEVLQQTHHDESSNANLEEEKQSTIIQSQTQENQTMNLQGSSKKKLLFYVYGGNYPETVSRALIARGNWQESREEDNIEKCNFLWRPFNYPAEVFKRIEKRIVRNQEIFIYNHFEILKGLVTKSGLIRSLKQFYFNHEPARNAGYSVFDSTPTTFLLASGVEDAEYTEMVSRYKDFQRGWAPKERIPIKHCVNNIWLVKPANANQGKGIEIFSDLEDLLTFVASRPLYTCCVVQKYIERPLLFKSRKFDIRVWALFTAKHEVFMYKHGYLRTSSDDYSLNNGNNYVHLTNNCLQKYGDNYGIHEEGNTIGFHVLQQYLDEVFPEHRISVQDHFIPRMRDLIIDSFLATKNQLNPSRRKHCFELLGYDFLIDEDFRLWMIEINTNPYFGVPNNFIANLLPKMVDDLLDIVVDPIYSPHVKPENCSRPNDFELLYCESNSNYSSNPVNLRRSYACSLYPAPELVQLVGPKAPKYDLKQLKQFKVQNLQLSTVSFKQKKPPKPKDEVMELFDKSTNNLLAGKLNQRSKSLAGGKPLFLNQNQERASQGLNLRNRNSRSRSSFKNASQSEINNGESVISTHKSKDELSKTIQNITMPTQGTQIPSSNVSSSLQTPQNSNSVFKTLKSQPQKQQFTSLRVENQQALQKSSLQPSLSVSTEAIKVLKQIGNQKSYTQQISNHQYMQPTANSTNRVQSTLNTSQTQSNNPQGQNRNQQPSNIIDVSSASNINASKTPQITSNKMIPTSTTKGQSNVVQDLLPMNKRVVDLATMINDANNRQQHRGREENKKQSAGFKNSTQMQNQISDLFEEIKADQARHFTERVPANSSSYQAMEESKVVQQNAQQPQVYQSKSPFKMISKSPSRVLANSQVSQSVELNGSYQGRSQDMFRRNQTSFSKNRASASHLGGNEAAKPNKIGAFKARDSSLGGRQPSKNARDSRISQVLTKDQNISYEQLLQKLFSQGKKQAKELSEKELDQIFDYMLKNLRTKRSDEWQINKSLETLRMLFENVMLRTHQIDQMMAQIIDLLSLECQSKGTLADQLIELLIQVSDKLCHKLILSKTQNTLTMLRLYQNSDSDRKLKFLRLFKQISIVQNKNIKNEPAIQKIISLINKPESNGVDMIVHQIHSRAIENGLLSLLVVENQINLEQDLNITKDELNSLASFFKSLPSKQHDLPFSSPKQSYSPDVNQNIEHTPKVAMKRVDYGQPSHQQLSPRVEMRVNLNDSFNDQRQEDSFLKESRIRQVPNQVQQPLTNHPMNSADKKFLINLNELANANQISLHQANKKSGTFEEGFLPSGQRSARVTTSMADNAYIVDLRDKEKFSSGNQRAADTEKERDTDSCLNSFKDLSTLNGLIGRSQDNGNQLRKEMIAEQKDLIEKLCQECAKNDIIAKIQELIQRPIQQELKTTISQEKNTDVSKNVAKQYHGYQSPFKKSIASTPQQKLIKDQPKSILSNEEKLNQQGKNNQRLGKANNNPNLSALNHNTAQINISSASITHKNSEINIAPTNEYSKGFDNKSSQIKYAPILRNKQIFPTPQSVKQSQPFSNLASKGGYFNQTQDDSYHAQKPQINKQRDRTIERQNANQTKSQTSKGRVSQLVSSQSGIGQKDKAFLTYQKFYQPQSSTPAQTLKQASLKMNEIEHNLNMLGRLTGSQSSPQKLKVSSSKAHQKSSDTFNKSPSLATMNNNFFNGEIYGNQQERSQMNTIDSQDKDGQHESLYHSNSEVQPRRDSAPNKIIMSSSHIMGADKNVHYYKRGTQVTQSKKNHQRQSQLELSQGATGLDTSLSGGHGLNADLIQFDGRSDSNQRGFRQQARRSNSRKASGNHHPQRMLFN